MNGMRLTHTTLTGLALLLLGLGLYRLGHATPADCPAVAVTPYFTIVYGAVMLDGAEAPVGAVIEAVSPRDDVVGCFVVTTAGAYGAMYVYGQDDSVTPSLPGMQRGETVRFRVDGSAAAGEPALAWADDMDIHRVDLTAPVTEPEPTNTPNPEPTATPTPVITIVPVATPTPAGGEVRQFLPAIRN